MLINPLFLWLVHELIFGCVTCMEHGHLGPERDGFNVRFNIFKDVPRTEVEAIAEGFTKISDCETNNFRGKQYSKNDDVTVIPLYDVNGHIAGLQTGIPYKLSNGYPSNQQTPPFILDGIFYKLTAYFVDPSIICRRGRSTHQFQRDGTGNDLFIQTGPNPEVDLMEIDAREGRTDWHKGLCFPGMGFHYFKDISLNMDCDTFFPVATLYYNGRLQGFAWSFGAILNSTYVSYEYPEPEFFNELMEEVPVCLKTLRRSTLHVYFTSRPEEMTCRLTSGATLAHHAVIVNISTVLLLLVRHIF